MALSSFSRHSKSRLNHSARKLYIELIGNDEDKALLTNAEMNIYSENQN